MATMASQRVPHRDANRRAIDSSPKERAKKRPIAYCQWASDWGYQRYRNTLNIKCGEPPTGATHAIPPPRREQPPIVGSGHCHPNPTR